MSPQSTVKRLLSNELTLHRVMFLGMLSFPVVQWFLKTEYEDALTFLPGNYIISAFGICCFIGTFFSDYIRKYSYHLLLAGLFVYLNSILWIDYLNSFNRFVNGCYVIALILGAMTIKEEIVLRVYFIYFGILFAALIMCTPLAHWISLIIHVVISGAVYYLVSNRQKYMAEIQLRREAAEKHSQELQDVLDCLSAMVVFKDRDNNFTLVNQAFANFTNRRKEDFVKMPLSELVKPGLVEQYHKEDLAIMDSGIPKYNIVEKIELPDGSTERWVRSDKRPLLDSNGKARGLVIYSVDITAQVEAENQLRESEQRFRLLFDKAPVGMVFTDSNLKILRVNEIFCKTVGYSEEQLLNLSLDELAKDSEMEKPSAYFKKQIAQKNTSYQIERRIVTGTGSIVFVESHVLVIGDEDGKVNNSLGVILDITERKNWEKQLLDNASKLEETNRELEDFAYAASHDLREPLRTITSYVQLLERRLKESLDGETKEFMGYVVKGAQRMNNLILALLEYSRASRTDEDRQLIDLNITLQEVAEDLQFQIEQSAAEISAGPLPTVLASDTQMRMLFQNLISNALKYQNAPPPRVEVSVSLEDGFWTFCFADNGIGILPEHFDHIFVLFRRLHTQEDYEGVGIGLAICKKIVTSHGGRIWVESNPGTGSRFYFTLPETTP